MNPSNSSSKKQGPDIPITNFPCKLCTKNDSDNDNAILLDLCQTWIRNKYNQFIILITNIYKVVINHGIAFLVPQRSFHWVI